MTAEMDVDKVNPGDIYHKLGKLEGVMETMLSNLSNFASHVEGVENRMSQRQVDAEGRMQEWRITVDKRLALLERTDASNEGSIKLSGWILTAIAVPVIGGLLSIFARIDPSGVHLELPGAREAQEQRQLQGPR